MRRKNVDPTSAVVVAVVFSLAMWGTASLIEHLKNPTERTIYNIDEDIVKKAIVHDRIRAAIKYEFSRPAPIDRELKTLTVEELEEKADRGVAMPDRIYDQAHMRELRNSLNGIERAIK